MTGQKTNSFERWLLIGLFAAALIYNLLGVTYNWKMGFMAGHEFRQAQTAITSYYIDKDNNFGLLYETPILGKPWVSILMEVPIYEWSVVGLSRATGWPQVEAARTVTAACFYLTLPALWLLLGRLGLSPLRRLLPLALVLAAPAYIFYSRAFLMDSMALLGSAWWLAAFVRTMDQRSWGWLTVAVVAGTLAALVKSAIFAVWLMPGAAYGAWLLWRDIRAGDGWHRPVTTVLWGAGTVVVSLGLLKAWIAYTDPLKAAHASAWIFTSKNLSEGNWGLFDPRPLFNQDIWRQLLHGWEQAIMSRWVIGLGLVAGVFLPGVRWRVLGVGSVFFAGQFLFPFAFAYQDYYFYLSAVFVLAALGFTLLGVIDSRLPRWAVVLIMAVPFTAQVTAYWQDYRKLQSMWHHGGYPFTDVLRDLTPKNSVIIVVGADWAAMTPLYSQRKALMIRNGLEFDRPYLERAYKELADEEVVALVVMWEAKKNHDFITWTAGRFDMDASQPTFSWNIGDIYVSRLHAREIQARIEGDRVRYPEIKLPEGALQQPIGKEIVQLNSSAAREAFFNIRPRPYQVRFEFGIGWLSNNNQTVLSAHPDTELWIEPPAGAKQIEWVYGFFPGAYEKPDAHTNGVEFSIIGELPNGETRRIYRRLVEPATNAAERGDLREVIAYKPLPGEKLKFSTGPMGNSAFDWAYIVSIKIE